MRPKPLCQYIKSALETACGVSPSSNFTSCKGRYRSPINSGTATDPSTHLKGARVGGGVAALVAHPHAELVQHSTQPAGQRSTPGIVYAQRGGWACKWGWVPMSESSAWRFCTIGYPHVRLSPI